MEENESRNKLSYEERLHLLTDLDKLSENIGQNLIHDQPDSPTADYCKQLIWTIGPSNRMLVWGLENNQNLAAMNGLRTLLENWANANYVLRGGKKGRDHYLSKIGEAAEYYRNAMQELRDNPTLSVEHLKQAPRWTGSGLESRVKMLGEGPLFQYEYLSRYIHADVWATLNEFDIQDRGHMNKMMLTWGIEFVMHALWLIYEEELVGSNLKDTITNLNDRVAAMLADNS